MSIFDKLRHSLKIFGRDDEDASPHNWYAEQRRKLENGEAIEPPWIVFPNSSPIYGWNQGWNQKWKNDIWDLFWQKMSDAEREEYLDRHQSSDEWRETLTVYWVGGRENSAVK